MNRLATSCIAVFLLVSFQTEACSCSGPNKFVHSIAELTVEVEVIGIDSVIIQSNMKTIYFNTDSTDFIQDFSNLHKGKYYVTLLQIRKIIRGVSKSDTLYLVKDYGFECFHTVPYQEIGQRYILSGNIEALPIVHSGDTTKNFRLFYLGSCLENILIIRNEKILGNVTHNKEARIERQMSRIIHVNRKLGIFYYNTRLGNRKNKERFLQKMGMRRFYRILKRRCKIIVTDPKE